MDKSINYKGHEISFYNLISGHHNIDKFILNGSLFNRPDHKFESIITLLKPNSIVYDIGAYIGSFAIPMTIEGSKVYAFEGFPDNYKRLEKNCLPYNISTYLIAVNNKNDKVKTKFNDCTDTEPQEREIEYCIFDSYIEKINIPKPDLVKLDIEGMETLALFGMTNLLENIRPIWQIGYHKGLEEKFEHYPGFVDISMGGFDFSTFK
ncbi:MAG TPA: FkbM family methyltransferase, partial [Methanosarcinales archaeon]|nr:FkbM family methyltransferase [Methanosarcinales archaeon]